MYLVSYVFASCKEWWLLILNINLFNASFCFGLTRNWDLVFHPHVAFESMSVHDSILEAQKIISRHKKWRVRAHNSFCQSLDEKNLKLLRLPFSYIHFVWDSVHLWHKKGLSAAQFKYFVTEHEYGWWGLRLSFNGSGTKTLTCFLIKLSSIFMLTLETWKLS